MSTSKRKKGGGNQIPLFLPESGRKKTAIVASGQFGKNPRRRHSRQGRGKEEKKGRGGFNWWPRIWPIEDATKKA